MQFICPTTMLSPGLTYWPFFCTTVLMLVPFVPLASLLCGVHSLALFSLLGDTLVLATLLIHVPIPVHCPLLLWLLKFLIVLYEQVGLAVLIPQSRPANLASP